MHREKYIQNSLHFSIGKKNARIKIGDNGHGSPVPTSTPVGSYLDVICSTMSNVVYKFQ